MKKGKGKLEQHAPASGAAPGVEPQAKPSPQKALASGARLLPCSSCPWRVDQDASAIPNYDRTLAYGLLSTVGDGDGFRQIMQCHGSDGSGCTPPRACAGYLAREGWSNINVRLLLMRGEIANPDEVLEACEAAGLELHPDYPSVLAKLERGVK